MVSEARDINNQKAESGSAETGREHTQRPLFDSTLYENKTTKNLLGEVVKRRGDVKSQ